MWCPNCGKANVVLKVERTYSHFKEINLRGITCNHCGEYFKAIETIQHETRVQCPDNMKYLYPYWNNEKKDIKKKGKKDKDNKQTSLI